MRAFGYNKKIEICFLGLQLNSQPTFCLCFRRVPGKNQEINLINITGENSFVIENTRLHKVIKNCFNLLKI